ncbi:MAG: hypothetical protein D6729_02520 [Deltaproteobacteria bacterium]|nr:MAG: hypothetical protein D6729_02520 [Deltaproteobacteria bacterium]
MKRLSFVLPALLVGCGALSGLTTITLGDGELPEFKVDRSYPIGSAGVESCPEGTKTLTDPRTSESLTVEISKLSSGCRMSLAQPQMLLFDESEARSASNKLQGMKIQGLESAALLIKDFSLTDENGAAIDLETRVDALSVVVDGNELFTREDILALPNGPVRKQVSGALLQKLVDGVNNGQAVRADVSAVIDFPQSAMQNLPGTLHVKTTLQPEVNLDVVEAAQGAAGG